MTSLSITLPVPPSANNLFINLPRGGRAKTSGYVKWLEEAGWHVKVAWSVAGRPAFVPPIRLNIELGVTTQRDITNCIKPIEDLIVASIKGMPDDAHNDFVTVWRDRARQRGTAFVTITDSS